MILSITVRPEIYSSITIITLAKYLDSAFFHYTTLIVSERRGFRGPGHLVSGADWIPGTASTPVSLSH